MVVLWQLNSAGVESEDVEKKRHLLPSSFARQTCIARLS